MSEKTHISLSGNCGCGFFSRGNANEVAKDMKAHVDKTGHRASLTGSVYSDGPKPQRLAWERPEKAEPAIIPWAGKSTPVRRIVRPN